MLWIAPMSISWLSIATLVMQDVTVGGNWVKGYKRPPTAFFFFFLVTFYESIIYNYFKS